MPSEIGWGWRGSGKKRLTGCSVVMTMSNDRVASSTDVGAPANERRN